VISWRARQKREEAKRVAAKKRRKVDLEQSVKVLARIIPTFSANAYGGKERIKLLNRALDVLAGEKARAS
jgi:hypothetical protein